MKTHNPTKEELNSFIAEYSWAKNMSKGGIDSYDNYAGPDLGDLVMVVSQSRDSDILAQSNFAAALDTLGGESKTVQVHRFGHWACGWIESIMVDPTDKKALKIAYGIRKALEHYPVLDDTDFYEREYQYQVEYAQDAQSDLAEALCFHFGLPAAFVTNKKVLELAFELNMVCQRYYGDDACINVYASREPDVRDIERLETCLREMNYEYKECRAYQYFCACLGLEEK